MVAGGGMTAGEKMKKGNEKPDENYIKTGICIFKKRYIPLQESECQSWLEPEFGFVS